VAGAHVFLINDKGVPAGPALETTTGDSGDYKIRRIPAGRFEVRFRRSGYRTVRRPDVTFGAGGQLVRLDVMLTEGRILSGRVVADDGTPVPGATIIGNNEEISTGRSDDQGNFALKELGDGPVSAFASAVGFAPQDLKNLKPGTTNVEFRLTKGAIVLGRISAEPMPERFTVTLSKFEAEVGKFVPLLNRAGGKADGEDFHFTDLAAGRYRLEAEAPGFRAQETPELDVTAGQTLSGFQIRLRKNP
jgi:hypothetical protein